MQVLNIVKQTGADAIIGVCCCIPRDSAGPARIADTLSASPNPRGMDGARDDYTRGTNNGTYGIMLRTEEESTEEEDRGISHCRSGHRTLHHNTVH